jgi:hypothetical protein
LLRDELATLKEKNSSDAFDMRREMEDLKIKLNSANGNMRVLNEQLEDALGKLEKERQARIAFEHSAMEARALASTTEARVMDEMRADQEMAALALAQKQLEEESRAADEAAWQKHQLELKLAEAQKTSDSLKYFRQDLCDWLNTTLTPSPNLAEDSLLRDLANGVILCELAHKLNANEQQIRDAGEALDMCCA